MKNNQVIILLILGIVALLGISIYAGIFSFSDNSTNNSTTFNITPPSGYSISNQTNNTITIDNGTKQLKVRKFSGNNSIYQRIESYKSKTRKDMKSIARLLDINVEDEESAEDIRRKVINYIMKEKLTKKK